MRRWCSQLAVLASITVAVLAGSSAAGAGPGNANRWGQNVDPQLVQAVTTDSSTGNGSSRFHVLVFGTGLDGAKGSSGVSWRNDLNVVGGESATLTGDQVAELSAQQGVQYITIDQPVGPAGGASTPVPSAAALATLYPQIDGAPGLWVGGDTGSGVGIAIIDSGVTPRADFGSRLVQVQLPTKDGTPSNDSVGHGSAVAGVAAGSSPDGKYVGIAPGATVYSINVARADGVYTSDVIAGLGWVLQNAKQNNIGVVNLSLTQVQPSSYLTNVLDTAVEQLWKQGIVVVVAAGNLGPDSEQFAPANDPWVITVGAADSNDTLSTADDSLATFSSYGQTPDGFSKPEIVAPGRHIITTIPYGSSIAQSAPAGYLLSTSADSYVRISGTSFSASEVSGAVALLLSQQPNLSPDQVKWILTQNERPLAGSSAGALDLGAAASALAHPDNANRGFHWSSFAHPGQTSNDFLNASPNAAAWDHAASWHAAAWDAAAWDAAAWDAAAWDAAAWDAAAWD